MKKKIRGKYKGFSKEDGSMLPIGYLDGYGFGDRLLEGVYFKYEVLPSGDLEVSTAPEDRDYMKDLNERKWLGVAAAAAKEEEFFAENPNGSGEDLILEKI